METSNDSPVEKQKLRGSWLFWIMFVIALIIFIVSMGLAKSFAFERSIIWLLLAIISCPPLQKLIAGKVKAFSSFILRFGLCVICFIGIGYMNTEANRGGSAFFGDSGIQSRIKSGIEAKYYNQGFTVLDVQLKSLGQKYPCDGHAYDGIAKVRNRLGGAVDMRIDACQWKNGDVTWKTY